MRWWCWVVLAGCAERADVLAPPGHDDEEVTPGRVKTGVPVDGPIPTSSAELRTRWIGRLTGPGQCPTAQAPFTTSRMFGVAAPPGLAPYCLYEAAVPGIPTFTGGPPAGFTMQPDLQVVVAAALNDIMSGPFATLTEQQVQRVPPLAAPSASPPRLTFVDTTPTASTFSAPWDLMGTNDHGYALTNLSRTFGCDASGRCTADLATRLGLHLVMDGTGAIVPDEVNGGEFGAIGYAAQAVRAEVEDWWSSADAPLVLNLSIGWDPEWGGDLGASGSWPLSVRAMFDALADAACHGALIVAASGNRLGGQPPDDRPLYPAGWGSVGLTPADCAARIGGSGSPVVAGDHLLLPVGAVDEHRHALPLSRVNSVPSVVAFGSHAVVQDSSGDPTSILTGTSIGAAVVATAAAAVWDNRPTLRAQQVADLVQASGVPANVDVAPFWCGTTCAPAQVVDVCDAVRWACDATSPGYAGAPCARAPTSISCYAGPPLTPNPSPVLLGVFDAATPDIDFIASSSWSTDPACGGGNIQLFGLTPSLPADPCPLDQYHSQRAEPWLYPQPMHEECPPCYLAIANKKLWVETSVGFATMQSLTLTITRTDSSVQSYTTYALPTSGNAAGFNLTSSMVNGAASAYITAVWTSSSEASADLQVLP
ncbi:MAG TPA: S8/S53 family peptidase [Myxococcota bacterium]|nr:S8/S53 family peptidase [Myxococcota bacterium]